VFEPDLWVCACEEEVVWVDVGWLDCVDVVVGALPGELEVLDGEVGVEFELLCDGAELLGDEGVDVPEPPGTEGRPGTETVGVVTVGIDTVGVVTVGVGRDGVDGVVTVSAPADGRAAMPITTSTVIATIASFRLLAACIRTRHTSSRGSALASPLRPRVADSLSAGPLA
jgi:hypothetical protein